MALQEKKRIPWLDIAKAFAIILVVFGHAVRGGAIHRIIYSFHVPAFFFLSGMTVKTDRTGKRIGSDALRLLVPYLSFGLASILVFALLGGFAADRLGFDTDTSLISNFSELLYASSVGYRLKFNTPLWFLPCLFAVKMLYYALNGLCRQKKALVLICSIALGALGAVYSLTAGPALPFNLSVAFKMLAFFSLGHFLAPCFTEGGLRLSRVKSLALGSVFLCICCSVAWFAPGTDYANDRFENFLLFLITSTAGTFAVVLISMSIGHCRPAEYVGAHTIGILVMHKFPLLLFQTVGPLKNVLVRYNTLANIAAAAVISAAAIALSLGAEWLIRKTLPFLFGDLSRYKRKK